MSHQLAYLTSVLVKLANFKKPKIKALLRKAFIFGFERVFA
jgi:hypothetical protein